MSTENFTITIQGDSEGYRYILQKALNAEYRMMQGIAVVESGKIIEKTAHETDVFHGLIPAGKFPDFRMLGFNDLQGRRHKSQRISDLVSDHGYFCVMIFKKLGYDLACIFILFHKMVHLINIDVV